MIYHKIRGRSVAECMMKLRSNFGSDAIILEHREVNEGGLLGSPLFSRKLYEIEYMLSEKGKGPKSSPGALNLDRDSASVLSPSLKKKLPGQGSDTKASFLSLSSINHKGGTMYGSGEGKDSADKGLEPIFSSFKRSGAEASAASPTDRFLQSKTLPSQKGDSLFQIREQLSRAQLSPAFASDFLHHLEDSLSRKEKSEPHIVEEKSLELLSQMIQTQPSQAPVRGECRALMLIGPTGVGKTTSLAKLAARFHIVEKRALSIYSLDHYRLAATEQLKTYANIMNIDFLAPLSKEEFAESLRRDGAELILIDSSGVSHSDAGRLEELKGYLELCRQEMSLETHLVLAANTNPGLLGEILESYERLGFDKILLTKLDESDFIGTFVEFADKYKRPFSFVTNGQEVPSDIRDANSREMAKILLTSPLKN